jgi:hypothetical protein
MKKLLSLVSIVFVLFISFGLSHAATYYVAQESHGDSSGISYSDRMSISNHNNSSFSPGDIIYLCGTITDRVEIPSSGTAEHPITYRGDYGVDAANIAVASGVAIDLDGQDYVVIDSVEISSGAEGISNMSGTKCEYVTIKKCKIHNTTNRGIFCAYFDNVTIGGASTDGNEIYDCGGDTAGGDIGVGSSSRNILISYNHLYGNGVDTGVDGVVIDTYAAGTIVEYNKIHDHWREDGVDVKSAYNVIVRYNDIYGHSRQTGITVQKSSRNIEVYGNRVWGNQRGIWIRDAKDDSIDVANVHIFSNIIFNNEYAGILFTSAGGVAPVGPFYIYNNIIAENCTNPTLNYHTGLGIAAGSQKFYVKNNIFYKNHGKYSTYQQVYTSISNDNLIFDNNYYILPSGSSGYIFYTTSDGLINFGQLQNLGNEENGQFSDTYSDIEPPYKDFINELGCDLDNKYSIAIDPMTTDWGENPPEVSVIERNVGSWGGGAYRCGYIKRPSGVKVTLYPGE